MNIGTASEYVGIIRKKARNLRSTAVNAFRLLTNASGIMLYLFRLQIGRSTLVGQRQRTRTGFILTRVTVIVLNADNAANFQATVENIEGPNEDHWVRDQWIAVLHLTGLLTHRILTRTYLWRQRITFFNFFRRHIGQL